MTAASRRSIGLIIILALATPSAFAQEVQPKDKVQKNANAKSKPPARKPKPKVVEEAKPDLTLRDVAPKFVLCGHKDSVEDLDFSPDGKALASVGWEDKTLRLWDTASGQQLAVFTKNLEMCRVRFSPDGNSIATDSTNYSNLPYKNEEFPPGDSIELWDVATGKNRVILANSFVTGLGDFEFSPDGKMLFITVHEFIARSFFYDLTKEPPDLNFRGGDRPSIPTNAFFAFSADWSMLASFSQEDQITLWDTKTREPIGTLELPKRRKGCSLAFSPNGRWLASGNDDGSLYIWYLNARSLKFAVKDSRQLIRAVAYSPDSRLLAAAGGDSMLRLYNTETGEKLVTIKAHEEYITSMKFSPDGKLIATGSGDRLIKLWDVDALLGRKP